MELCSPTERYRTGAPPCTTWYNSLKKGSVDVYVSNSCGAPRRPPDGSTIGTWEENREDTIQHDAPKLEVGVCVYIYGVYIYIYVYVYKSTITISYYSLILHKLIVPVGLSTYVKTCRARAGYHRGHPGPPRRKPSETIRKAKG